jgi:CAAX protease family protein
MAAIASLVRRHPTVAYFALAFAISWSGGLLAIGSAGGMQGTTPGSDPRFAYALIAMLAGPSMAGLLLTRLVSGREGLRRLLSRLRTWRVGVRWYALAILTAPILMMATLLALSISSPAFVPGIFASDHKAPILAAGLAVGLSAGVFEELGWTGFATPTLCKRHRVLATGFIVGFWWSAWHLLPNLWSARAAAGELPMSIHLAGIAAGLFIGYLTAFRVLMVWVYERTGSLLMGMVMHASFTASLLILNPVNMSGLNLLIYSFALAAAVWIVDAVVLAVDAINASPSRTARAHGSAAA